MAIDNLFKFYKQKGSTVLSMSLGIAGFTKAEELQEFINEAGLSLVEPNRKEFVSTSSRREIKIVPALSSNNILKLANLSVQTASKNILRGSSVVAALDCTGAHTRRIAIAF